MVGLDDIPKKKRKNIYKHIATDIACNMTHDLSEHF